MRTTFAAIMVVAAVLAGAPARAASSRQMPVVPCKFQVDEQTRKKYENIGLMMGWDRPPTHLSRNAASRLAIYQVEEAGVRVLAPRGWRCIADGPPSAIRLVVAPPTPGGNIVEPGGKISGPAVEAEFFSLENGTEEARFRMGAIVGRTLPVSADNFPSFYRNMPPFLPPVPTTPYPADKITLYQFNDLCGERCTHPPRPSALGDDDHYMEFAMFVTSPRMEGLGTQGILAPDDMPIFGFVGRLPDLSFSIDRVVIRLPPGSDDLARAIQRNLR